MRAILDSPDLSLDVSSGRATYRRHPASDRTVSSPMSTASRSLRRIRAPGHPSGNRDVADPDQRGSLLCREPVHALCERGRQSAALAYCTRSSRSGRSLNGAGLDSSRERPQAQAGSSRSGTRSFFSTCRVVRVADPKACQCGEVLKGVRSSRGSASVRHRLHSGDPDRHLHGLLRRVLVLPITTCGRPAQGSGRQHGRLPLDLQQDLSVRTGSQRADAAGPMLIPPSFGGTDSCTRTLSPSR